MGNAELSTLAAALTYTGVLGKELLEAADLEARLAVLAPQPLITAAPSAFCCLAWALANVPEGADRSLSWRLLAGQLEAAKSLAKGSATWLGPEAWSKASSSDRALLYEALATHSALTAPWPELSAAAELVADARWKALWQERQQIVAAPSTRGSFVQDILQAAEVKFEANVGDGSGLFEAPFLLRENSIVLDLCPAAPRHPVSGQAAASRDLRNRVWQSKGFNVLAIPDTVWPHLEAQAKSADPPLEPAARQRDWLKAQLDKITRREIALSTGLQDSILEQLAEVPLLRAGGLLEQGLRELAKASPEVQQRSVTRFLKTWKEERVTNINGWLVGIIKEQKAALEKSAAAQASPKAKAGAASSSSSGKPGGPVKKQAHPDWSHERGKSLSSIKTGDIVEGPVTNVLVTRVWVNAGLQKDVTFESPQGSYKKGDFVKGLEIVRVDVEKQRVEAKATTATTKGKGPAPKAKAKAKAAPQGKAAAPPGEKKEAASRPPPKKEVEEVRTPIAQSTHVAAAKRPETGWTHKGGTELAAFNTGQLVTGKVTNVLGNRVFVDIGAVVDASFWTEGTPAFKVGDEIPPTQIHSINFTIKKLDKVGQVILRQPS